MVFTEGNFVKCCYSKALVCVCVYVCMCLCVLFIYCDVLNVNAADLRSMLPLCDVITSGQASWERTHAMYLLL